jgi:pSer/pThr/pTyr-binding forkhead associated (FHA) protein
MNQDGKCPPELYDPTVRTTADEVQAAIDNPGRLIESTGDGESKFELDRPLILIGSDPAADIVVVNTKVADYVAEITFESDFYTLRRLADRCKVTVAGKPVKEHILADGDEIQVADRTFVYRAPAHNQQTEE